MPDVREGWEGEGPRRTMGRREVLITAVVVGWLAVQLLVPVVRLVERGGAARPRTFGWQMFSHQVVQQPETFTITTANGSRAYDVRDLLAGPMRREVVYGPTVIAELCARPEILAVEVHDVEHGSRRVTCR